MKDKRGSMNLGAVVTGAISVIIGIIVIFQNYLTSKRVNNEKIIGNTSGELTTSATNISGSGFPLASLFGSSGTEKQIDII